MSLKHPMLDVFRSPMEDNSIESMATAWLIFLIYQAHPG
jgi:hypothetical protein